MFRREGNYLLLLFLLLFLICIFDYKDRRIPNWSLFCLLGVWTAYVGPDVAKLGFCETVLPMIILFILLYPLFQRSMLGAGDVKLLVLCTGFLRIWEILPFLFIAFLSAAVLCLIRFAVRKDFSKRMHYFLTYAVSSRESGVFGPYYGLESDRYASSIPLAGPVTLGMLLVFGGRYL